MSVAEMISESFVTNVRRGRSNMSVKELPMVPAKELRMGDELCKERTIPISLLLIKKVTKIYNNCDAQRKYSQTKDTPLMEALKLGLMDMVWGFIECAKQTNSNLLTHETGDNAVREFLWLSNVSGETAFDLAISINHVGVASLLLKNAPVTCLESQWKRRGKTQIIPLFNSDPKYDGIIFDMLEKEKRGELLNPPTSPPQESIIDTESVRNLNSHYTLLPQILSNLDHGLLGLNPNRNTILHLVSKVGDVKHVKDIIEKHPTMICSRNSDEVTPVYTAASEGRADILQTMLRHLRKENKDIEGIVTRTTDKHNALHVAIQNHHVEVVFLLLEELPELANRINNYYKSPLYLAAERKFYGVLKLLLNKCNEISFVGPNGKTALHAAAISDSPECTKYLLNERRDLLNVKDENGWTPFYYAICNNSSLATRELLNVDKSIGYQKLMTKDDINTWAIHIAASRGHYETMKVLMSKCLGCSEFIDNQGKNILHVAVENKNSKVIEFIFQDKSLTSLINQKDSNGDTPIHLLVASDFEMMEKVMDFRVDLDVLNNEKQTPLDKTSSHNQRERLIKGIAMAMAGTSMHIEKNPYGGQEKEREAKQKEAETRFKLVENLLVVATLIATASFAAGITLPGGLHSDEASKLAGTPILIKKAPFIAFIVTNAIAFCFSSSTLLIYLSLLKYREVYADSPKLHEYIDDKINGMYVFTKVALTAMAVAFVTGVYVVLTPSPPLAISLCIFISIFTYRFLVYF